MFTPQGASAIWYKMLDTIIIEHFAVDCFHYEYGTVHILLLDWCSSPVPRDTYEDAFW